ncbi:hypothetical protein MiSe_76450 [Microseira wollei NIES-4236]|uniref:Uncharacterized protein n=1 Tax=Microseira wollei NIES-4236 TaxID=2530354 RepID=A0AAV3XIT4_9CYAN|nr:hypothetical protein MiSe_76450 [Microseira wollei NIES-4236]
MGKCDRSCENKEKSDRITTTSMQKSQLIQGSATINQLIAKLQPQLYQQGCQYLQYAFWQNGSAELLTI